MIKPAAALLIGSAACALASISPAALAQTAISELHPQAQKAVIEFQTQSLRKKALATAPSLNRNLVLLNTADKDFLDAVIKDAVAAQGLGVQAEVERIRLEQNLEARTYLQLLSMGAVPEDALKDVRPSLNYTTLKHASSVAKLNVEDIQALRRTFSLGTNPMIESVNPNTPVQGDPMPGVMPPGYSRLPPGTFNDNANRREDPVWRKGFSNVVAIADASGAPPLIHCSGLLLTRRLVLTALHCLAPADRSAWRGIQDIAAYVPFQGGTVTLKTKAGETNAGMLRVALTRALWVGDVDLPSVLQMDNIQESGHDLILLELVDTVNLPGPFHAVKLAMSEESVSNSVTVAGYGYTNAMQRVNDLALEIAVRNQRVVSDGDFFVFPMGEAANNHPARFCPGDSGAPLFNGALDGSEANPYTLLGVVTGMRGYAIGTSGEVLCLAGQQLTTRVNRPEITQWLCKKDGVSC